MRVLAALILLFSGAGRAQFIDLSNGVHLKIETTFGNPTGQQVIQAALSPASGDSFYRIFRDQNGLAVYAYQLLVDRPGGGDDFRLTVKPAGTGFAQAFPGADGGKPVPTIAADRELPWVHSGDKVPFDVFELAGTGQKVVDTIELSIEPGSRGQQRGGLLRFAGLRVYINRTLVPSPQAGIVSGRFVMFYLPGRGGYFFSTEPPANRAFVQAGWIDRTRMQFTLDNETYECVADAPILSKSDRGEIWAYHDPSYTPGANWTLPLGTSGTGQSALFFTAAADTLNWWLPQTKPL